MPRLKADRGDLRLVVREPQDKAKLPCIVAQPLVFCRVLEIGRKRTADVHIDGKSGLMLAGTRSGRVGQDDRLRFFLGQARILCHFVSGIGLKQHRLVVVGAESAVDRHIRISRRAHLDIQCIKGLCSDSAEPLGGTSDGSLGHVHEIVRFVGGGKGIFRIDENEIVVAVRGVHILLIVGQVVCKFRDGLGLAGFGIHGRADRNIRLSLGDRFHGGSGLQAERGLEIRDRIGDRLAVFIRFCLRIGDSGDRDGAAVDLEGHVLHDGGDDVGRDPHILADQFGGAVQMDLLPVDDRRRRALGESDILFSAVSCRVCTVCIRK